MIRRKDIEKFWSKVDKSGECWLWTGRVDRDGYGSFTIVLKNGRREQRANRVALILDLGRDLVKGEQSLHHCDNPPCVRVGDEHIFSGNATINVADRDAKGRGVFPGPTVPSSGDRHWTRLSPEVLWGERNPNAKLTVDQVLEIRSSFAAGVRQTTSARDFGVSFFAIKAIVKRMTWKHVEVVEQ